MTVSHLFYDGRARTIDTHDQRKGDFDKNEEGFTRFMRAAILCNNATYNKENMIIGDASESGLLKFGNPNLNDTIAEFRRKRQKLHGIPFNSKNKWQLSIHRTSEDSSKGPVIVMKGAPERVLQYCDRILLDEQVKPLRQEDIDSIMHGLNSFATQGERVLGFCELELDGEAFPEDYKFQGDSPDEANFPFRSEKNQSEGFVFLGLSAMIDPPRPSVPQSVLKCQSAGISVFMVTGDHPTTARAIASKVNIIAPKDSVFDLSKIEKPTLEDIESSDSTACVVTGSHITLFTNDVSADSKVRFWNGILSHKHIVFSRTSPQQKLLIVESCQKRNGIVAVTGDGVNDSPALKKADIGIAMGVAGTDVAKEAANMILMDDNFSSIVNGVEEGRVLFDNLKKVCYQNLVHRLHSLLEHPRDFPRHLQAFDRNPVAHPNDPHSDHRFGH
ncbi:Sodium/potassium-transporting ATPase subunit alpha-1 [Bonamia ostreae]|uniref:Sodium/potassium-transporting ATPase subunit alpha-1 n=1 Tax=Bonamia ostreae TaxID=126728 RepID=A0ABV2ALK0_9EUKA